MPETSTSAPCKKAPAQQLEPTNHNLPEKRCENEEAHKTLPAFDCHQLADTLNRSVEGGRLLGWGWCRSKCNHGTVIEREQWRCEKCGESGSSLRALTNDVCRADASFDEKLVFIKDFLVEKNLTNEEGADSALRELRAEAGKKARTSDTNFRVIEGDRAQRATEDAGHDDRDRDLGELRGRDDGEDGEQARGTVGTDDRDERDKRPLRSGTPREKWAWINEVNESGVARVAEAFGVTVKRTYLMIDCFECGRRHQPKRGSGGVGFSPTAPKWCCHFSRCDAEGDAVNLASYLVLGKKKWDSAHERERLYQECFKANLCVSPYDFHKRTKRATPRGERSRIRSTPTPSPTSGGSQPSRPPSHEVDELWAQSGPCSVASDTDGEIEKWFNGQKRRLDCARIDDEDLARALPSSAKVYEWTRRGKLIWNRAHQQWIILLLLWGATGEPESIHARALRPKTKRDKAANPDGYEVRGLVFADRWGQLLLQGSEDGREQARRCGVVVTEGAPDFLRWATRTSESNEDAPVVFGVISGSWSDGSIAARIPDGVKIAVRTHLDDRGERYARQIIDSLRGRCNLYRATDQDGDEMDLFMQGRLPIDPFEGLERVEVTEAAAEGQLPLASGPAPRRVEVGDVMAAEQDLADWGHKWKAREPAPTPKIKTGKDGKSRADYYFQLTNALIDTGVLRYARESGAPRLLDVYCVLRSNVFRGKGSQYPEVRKLLRDGLLFARAHQGDIGAALGIKRGTVAKHLKLLCRLGWARSRGDADGVNLYVLGERRKRKGEHYYCDDWIRGVTAIQERLAAARPDGDDDDDKKAKMWAEKVAVIDWMFPTHAHSSKQGSDREDARSSEQGVLTPVSNPRGDVRSAVNIHKETNLPSVEKGKRKTKHTKATSGGKDTSRPQRGLGAVHLVQRVWEEEWKAQPELDDKALTSWTPKAKKRLAPWIQEVGVDMVCAAYTFLLRMWPEIESTKFKNNPGPPTPETLRNNPWLMAHAKRLAPHLPAFEEWSRWWDEWKAEDRDDDPPAGLKRRFRAGDRTFEKLGYKDIGALGGKRRGSG